MNVKQVARELKKEYPGKKVIVEEDGKGWTSEDHILVK